MAVCGFLAPPGSGHRPPTVRGGASESGPSAILVVLDTARRDHLSLYRYDRETTPHIDRWARNALVFDNATATSSWTLPSHASMFTGLYPRSHAAHGFRGERAWGNAYPLDRERTTLAELASAEGIVTAAIVANHFYLSPRFGLDQGFQSYVVLRPRLGLGFQPADWLAERFSREALEGVRWPYYRAEVVTDLTIEWLETARDRRFFLFVNYMDVHSPNRRPPTPAVPAGAERSPESEGIDLEKPAENLPPAVRKYLVNQYDRELIRLDRELGRLFAFLASSGLEDRTTVFLTSDHGEYLGEHGLLFHSQHLHDEVINVPLVVRGPGIRPGRSSTPVQSVDLFPAVLEGTLRGEHHFALRPAERRRTSR